MQLIRNISTDKYGCFGRLYDKNNKFVCFTLERPYKNNERFVSSVPIGRYDLVKHSSSRYGDVVALVDESIGVFHEKHQDGRYGILIHPANTAGELQGCIAPGMDIGVVYGRWAVTHSRDAVKEVMKLFNAGDDELVIL